MSLSRNLALGGIAGPLLFALVVITVAVLRGEYDHATQFISELGETGGEYSSLMNALGFKTSAALIMGFAISLRQGHRPEMLPRFAWLFIGIFATGMFLAGVFPCDKTCLVPDPSREQLLHNIVSFVAFAALSLAAMLAGVSLRKDPAWRRFSIYSLVSAGTAMLFLFAMVAAAPTRSWSGGWQRLFLGTLFLWMARLAYRLWRERSQAGSRR